MKEPKYSFTDRYTELGGHILTRIRAERRIILNDGTVVNPGELGGWIEKEWNLDHKGSCWIADDAKVYGNANVSDHAVVSKHALISDNVIICGSALVTDYATVRNHAVIGGNATVGDHAVVSGAAVVSDDAYVVDYANVTDHARLQHRATVAGHASIRCDAVLRRLSDYVVYENVVDPDYRFRRYVTYTMSNDKWTTDNGFVGSDEELIEAAMTDCASTLVEFYESIVQAQKRLNEIIRQTNDTAEVHLT